MKQLLLVLFSFFLLTACEKTNDVWSKEDDSVNSRTPQPKVTLCHFDTESNAWNVINVNPNAVPAHLAHGDMVLVDDDGDGWVAAENECVPGGDCDDNNPDVNPGASETCDNEVDDDCDGDMDSADSDCDTGELPDPCTEAQCCFCSAIPVLNLTCWNGDPDHPILWDADSSYGICTSCLGDGNCGYSIPDGIFDSGAPGSEACREYLLALVIELNLGIGPQCSFFAAPGGPSNTSPGSGSTTNYFGK